MRLKWCSLLSGICLSLALIPGCQEPWEDVLAAFGTPSGAPLFEVPLAIEGRDIGGAVIDTGGGYEVMLRENFGLEVIDTVDVLAFGGRQSVDLTEGFVYTAGGVYKVAETALVGKSICDCNGLGFHFFRETGVVLGLDFTEVDVTFLRAAPGGGVSIAFEPAPPDLSGFDTAFIPVDVAVGLSPTSAGDRVSRVVALLDTGANATLIRRGLVDPTPALPINRQDVTIRHELLGTVAVTAALFDTEGLPDVIIGTDVMGTWGKVWYFTYERAGGRVDVLRPGDTVELDYDTDSEPLRAPTS
jgi:hypothetical protein